jgi:hypothetical protein
LGYVTRTEISVVRSFFFDGTLSKAWTKKNE